MLSFFVVFVRRLRARRLLRMDVERAIAEETMPSKRPGESQPQGAEPTNTHAITSNTVAAEHANDSTALYSVAFNRVQIHAGSVAERHLHWEKWIWNGNGGLAFALFQKLPVRAPCHSRVPIGKLL